MIEGFCGHCSLGVAMKGKSWDVPYGYPLVNRPKKLWKITMPHG